MISYLICSTPDFYQEFERWTYERSGWAIYSILQHQFVISEIAPWEGSSYFPLPKELRNPMKGLISIQNKNNALDGV